MFDSFAPEPLSDADDATVVGAVAGWARDESAAAARRLAAIAEMVDRHCAPDGDERLLWACDLWDAIAAEIGAALGISARRASSQMHLARSLRERLPHVNALFLAGEIGARLVSTISWRTHLVIDSGAMAAIDTAIAETARRWGTLSDAKVERAIDALVDEYDPAAREWFQQAERGLDIEFGKPDDATGTRSVRGRIYNTHAELIERRLAALATTVCDADPRSIGQLRAEAIATVFAGGDHIACRCGTPDCPNPDGKAMHGSVVIHIVADQTVVQEATTQAGTATPPAPHENAPAGTAKPDRPGVPDNSTQPDPAGTDDPAQPVSSPEPPANSTSPRRRPAAVMADGSVIPTALLVELIRNGATLTRLRTPCGPSENQYRPSIALQRFVRCRDMTCRFPGCDAPAEVCDIDHAIAYPAGPTHPSNLRCLCRKHHLLRTFYTGWTDKQNPDGSIVWTSPSGHIYTTHPGSRIHFPHWDVTTAELPASPVPAPAPPNRELQMPRRRRTRTAEQQQRIKNRRAQKDTS